MVRTYLFFLGMSLVLISCKGTKDSTSTDDGTCTLLVSFYSPGNGIDHKMKAKYETFLRAYGKDIAIGETRWGKEGEIDMCITLGKMSKKEEADFVNKSKELLSTSSRVRVSENESTRH